MSDESTLSTPILIVTLASLIVTVLLSGLKIRKLWRERRASNVEDPEPPRMRLVKKDHDRLYKIHKNLESVLQKFELDRASVS